MGAVEGSIGRTRASSEASEHDRGLGPEWMHSITVAFATRALFFSVGIAASWLLLDKTTGAPALGFEEMWRRWDAHHLLTIAEFGYTAPQSDAHAAAFFPAFPLAVRPLLWLGLSPVVAGLFVAGVAAVVAGVYLYRLAEEEIGSGAGARSLLYLSMFPTAVFLVAPYSESLFLVGAIAAFYYARRGNWAAVGIPTAVAMGSRAAGLFLIFGLALELLRQRNFSPRRLAEAGLSLVVGLLPLAAYVAFLHRAMGDGRMFLIHQSEGWGRTPVGPVASFLNTWNTWEIGTYPTNWLLAWRGEIVAVVLGLACVVWALVKREWGYAGFMGSFMLVLIWSTWYYSVPRMLLSMFPIVLFLTEAAKRRPGLHEWVLIAFAPFALLGVVVYTQGGWFY